MDIVDQGAEPHCSKNLILNFKISWIQVFFKKIRLISVYIEFKFINLLLSNSVNHIWVKIVAKSMIESIAEAAVQI